MKSHAIVRFTLGIAALGMLTACSTVNEKAGLDVPEPKLSKTATGAVTGAAVGGGLGLIIGSTSGSAGEGLLVGSVAGGALGAGVGAKLQRDADATELAAQQDSVVRQGEQINQQNDEINELKKNSGDEVQSFYDAPIRQPVLAPEKEMKTKPAAQRGSRGRLASAGGLETLNAPSGVKRPQPYGRTIADDSPRLMTASVKQSTVTSSSAAIPPLTRAAKKSAAPVKPESIPAEVKKEKPAETKGLPPATTIPDEDAAADVEVPKDAAAKEAKSAAEAPKDLANCKEALKEAERGLHAGSDADRLFYLRRAARLCPTEPSYHVELGKLYSTIGKGEDAKYELRQAIDLDPSNQVARDELSILENSKGAQ